MKALFSKNEQTIAPINKTIILTLKPKNELNLFLNDQLFWIKIKHFLPPFI